MGFSIADTFTDVLTRQPVQDQAAVLGIDAAWTPTQPSGVALAVFEGGRWRLAAIAPSYSAYQTCGRAAAIGQLRPDISALLEATKRIHEQAPSLVAVDIPLARHPIVGRRKSDNAVSRAYGARHCSTHTPSDERPGAISDRMTEAFALAGYPLATAVIDGPALIEVYPHPALVELCKASKRLPYKLGKVRRYWPELSPNERRASLIDEWRRIVDLLDREIAGTSAMLPIPAPTAPGAAMKAFEDMLDAVVCAWVGVCALEGRAIPYGDDHSAIWIPRPVAH